MPRDRRKKHATRLTFYKDEANRRDAVSYGFYTYCGRKVSNGTLYRNNKPIKRVPRVAHCPGGITCKFCQDYAYYEIQRANRIKEQKKNNAGLQPVRADN